MTTRVLIVDDEPSLCELLEAGLRRRGFVVASSHTAAAALQRLEDQPFDVVVTDLSMPEMDGIELCTRVVANRPDLPVVVLTAFGSLDSAVAAIRAGAYDFITKPVQVDALAIAVERAASHRKLRDEVKRLRIEVAGTRKFDELIGESSAMRALRDIVARIADTDASVLITGESGTGKEVVARALHRAGRRKDGPLVAVNCAAMPEPLLESELFGHVKGAFTDARAPRQGLFAQADGGTLFLDEIGDMPIGLQPKLLRALEERKVRPVGSSTEIPVDVRLICATNRDLETEIEEKRFREDLYFRINVIHVDLAPLRARGADVLLLAQHFVREYASRFQKSVAGLSAQAAQRLQNYAWPGNVRELRNCIERAVALTRYEDLTVDDLPEKIRDYRTSHVVVAADDPSELVPLDEVEKRYVLRVLEAVGGNKAVAARILKVDRRTLYRKLEAYGVDMTTKRSGPPSASS